MNSLNAMLENMSQKAQLKVEDLEKPVIALEESKIYEFKSFVSDEMRKSKTDQIQEEKTDKQRSKTQPMNTLQNQIENFKNDNIEGMLADEMLEGIIKSKVTRTK